MSKTKSIFEINEKIKTGLHKPLDVNVGDNVKILIQLKEANQSKKVKGNKTQTVQGLVIAKKHNKELGATLTIRSIVDGVGVEWVIPIYADNIIKVDIIKSSKVKRSKLYYIRNKSVKESRAKLRKEIKDLKKEVKEDAANQLPEEEAKEEVVEIEK